MDMRLHLFRRRSRLIVFLVFMLCLVVANIFGVFIHPFEVDFDTNFSYPLDLKDLREAVQVLEDMKLRPNGHHSELISRLRKLPKPINQYNYRYIIHNKDKCGKSRLNTEHQSSGSAEDITLLIVIKSAIDHSKARDAIRKSWGFEKRFSDVIIKRVFILGNCLDRRDNCQDLIDDEFEAHEDIIQSDFVDTYYNNTIKIMIGFKWAVEHCSNAQFILFVDDDYYVSVKNLLKFVRNPVSRSFDDQSSDENVFDGRLYSGFVFPSSSPLRHRPSKWFVSLEEYPFSRYPPYVTAGAIVLSNQSLADMHFASYYTKHFRFDDIYVGILAKKLSIVAIHNENFHFWPFSYDTEKYWDVIAAHGFSDPKHLLFAWNQQKSLGNA